MLINSSTSPRSSTVTQPTIRPWRSATRTSSARTLFGSRQAAESRLTSVKTDSERTVPNPTSSSSSTEEVAISTIAGISRRFAARIWILALVRATAMDRSTRFFLFLCADARLQAAGRDHHEDKDDESPGEGDDLPAARGHLKGGNLGPVSAVLLVEVLQHPFGRAPHVTDSKDQQTEREDQCGKHRSAPRRAPEILRVEVAHHEVEDRTEDDGGNRDPRGEAIRERDELEQGVLSRRHSDPRDRRPEDHHRESEAADPQDGGSDVRVADDELEDVGHAWGYNEPVMNSSTFSPPVLQLTPRVDDTEEIALGVSEDDEVFIRLARPIDGGAELKQPLDLSVRGVRVQVEVQSAPIGLHLVDGHVRPLSGRVFQNHKRVVRSGRPPRSITQGVLPEGHHLSEVVDVDHDRPDPYGALPHGADDFGDRSRRFRLPTTTLLETRLAILRRTALLALRHDSGRPAKGNPGASSPDRGLAVGPVRCHAAVYGAHGLRRPPAGRLTRLLPDPGPLREVRQGLAGSGDPGPEGRHLAPHRRRAVRPAGPQHLPDHGGRKGETRDGFPPDRAVSAPGAGTAGHRRRHARLPDPDVPRGRGSGREMVTSARRRQVPGPAS